MGQHRQELEQLAQTDPMIRRAMDLIFYGEMSYEDAMEALAITKHKESEAYKQQLISRMMLEGPPPIYVSSNDITTKIFCPIPDKEQTAKGPFNWSESCWCAKCDEAARAKSSNPMSYMRMNVCPACCNKRCPKATDHRQACSGSNDPGQPGSRY